MMAMQVIVRDSSGYSEPVTRVEYNFQSAIETGKRVARSFGNSLDRIVIKETGFETVVLRKFGTDWE